MERHILNKLVTNIHTDGRVVAFNIIPEPNDALFHHPLVQLVDGHYVEMVGVRDKGKHENVWMLLKDCELLP